MKKIISTILGISLAFTIVACTTEETQDSNLSSESTTVAGTTDTTTVAEDETESTTVAEESNSNTQIDSNEISNLEINLYGYAHVEILSSEDSNSVELNGPDNFIDAVEYNVNGNSLEIRQNRGYDTEDRPEIIVNLTNELLEEVEINLEGNITLSSELDVNDLELNMAGASEAVFLNVDELDLNLAGNSRAEFQDVTNFDIDQAGDSEIAINSVSGDGDFESEGAGFFTIGESEMNDLTVEIRGAGTLEIDGSVNNLDGQLLGAGVVRLTEVRGQVNVEETPGSTLEIG